MPIETPPRKPLLITGATGYIGSALFDLAVSEGWSVICLGRRSPPLSRIKGVVFVPWRMTEPVPAGPILEAAPDGLQAVVHLAHDWADDTSGGGTNLQALDHLLTYARETPDMPFILASSVNASAEARNSYGRIKFEQEQRLTKPGEVAARIGLVYGGPDRGQWKTLRRLVEKLPIIPLPGGDRLVHPVAVDDLARGLLCLATAPFPTARIQFAAAETPLPFAQFLRQTARHNLGCSTLVLSIPFGLLSPVLAIVFRLNVLPSGLVERINGLASLKPISPADGAFQDDTSADDLNAGLARWGAVNRRNLVREARVLFRYLGIRAPVSLLKTYVRSCEQAPVATCLPLSHLSTRFPFLLGLSDAIRPRSPGTELIRSRLDLCLSLMEFPATAPAPYYAYQRRSVPAVLFDLLILGVRETLLFPFRLLRSR